MKRLVKKSRSIARNTWKASESRAAGFFGAVRTPLSGRNSRHTASDSLHPALFLESKHYNRSAIWKLWDKTKALAIREKTLEHPTLSHKTPVLCIHRKGSPGFLIVCHSDDFDQVAGIRKEALHKIERAAINKSVDACTR